MIIQITPITDLTMTSLSESTTATRHPPHFIPDQYESPTAASYPSLYEGHLHSVLIPNSLIIQRTSDLAQEIYQSFGPDKVIVLLCVLKGASVFFHYLLNALSDLKQPYQYEFIRCSSYSGTQSTHTVLIDNTEKLEKLLPDRHVIVVEDIVDTGLTLKILLPQLRNTCHPKSLEVCTLLEKRLPQNEKDLSEDQSSSETIAKYCGFSIPNKFIIGFGLDFNDLYRDLKDIWVISDLGVSLGGKL